MLLSIVLPAITQQGTIRPPIQVNPNLILKSNWNFTNGLSGWTKTGNAFDNQPTVGNNVTASRVRKSPIGGDYWDVPFPIGNKDLPWIGTYENHPNNNALLGQVQGDGPTGTLTSTPFTVNKPFISFLIGGGNNFANESLQIETLEGQTWKPTPFLATGRNNDQLYRIVWSTAPIAGKTARIVIRDLSSGPWGHVNVADIRFHDTDPTPTLSPLELAQGLTELGDADTPVWGLADLHAHPLANLGFGGNLYCGTPEGPIAEALASCNSHHGKDPNDKWFGPAKGFFIAVGDVLEMIGIVLALPYVGFNADLAKPMLYETDGDLHSGVGYPALMSYRYYNTTHQHMYIDWIRRSYDGGLRLMVAHPVSNNLLANLDPKAQRDIINDKESGDAQIAGIKTMVSHNQSWMQIAYSPAEARNIIRQNKLCIVLGMEIDNIGNFHASDNVTPQQLNSELDRLWAMGVRHMFPIHLADSVFGGSAVYSDMFNFNNLFANHRSLQVDEGSQNGIGYKLGITEDKIKHIVGNLPVNINFNDGSNWKLPSVLGMLHLAEPNISNARAHINRVGLTQLGEEGINHLLDMGMLVDIDHMSDKAADRLLTLCEQREKNGVRGYPVVSGHSDFRDLAYPWGSGLTDGTLGQESQKSASVCQRIMALGGMFAPITEMMNRRTAPGSPVTMDAPGTSKTFAQSLWYACNLPGTYGVGIGTDLAMLGGMGPRFGTDASPALTLPGGNPIMPPKVRTANGGEREITDEDRNQMLNQRRRDAEIQTNGVRYDSAIQDYRRYRFFWTYGNCDYPIYSERQRDLWEALAIDASRVNWNDAEQPGLLQNRSLNTTQVVKNFARGLQTSNPAELVLPVAGIGKGNYFVERRVGFLIKHPNDLGRGPGSESGSEEPRVLEFLHELKGVVQSWSSMTGQNTPLKRIVYTGTLDGKPYTRDFDFNIDGLAHYGMVPDMLQDVKNVGMAGKPMQMLFNGAEAYIRMWEKAWKLRR